MLKHFILIAFRNLKRHTTSSIINITSLSIGLTCALFIYFWVTDEMQVDQFHEKSNRLVQVLQNSPSPNGLETEPYTQGPLAKALADELPEIEYSASVIPYEWFEGEQHILSDGGEKFFIANNQFASEDYFQLFSYELIYGDQAHVLTDENAIVISEELSNKLFETTDAIGKTIEWIHDEYGGTYQVSGVFAQLPATSTNQFDAVFNIKRFLAENDDLTGWTNSDPYTYATLHPHVSLAQFNQKIEYFLQTKNAETEETLMAQKYADRYLHGIYENGRPVSGRIAYVKLFSLVALFILLIAGINFMNMSTAKAAVRLKEVGVKKVMGADRHSLLAQYLTESTILSLISLVIALGLIHFLLPIFNEVTGKQLALHFGSKMMLGISGIAVLTGLFSGSYPALYLSRFSPVQIFKNKTARHAGHPFARHGLMIFQFAISIILLVAVLVVFQQVDLIQSKNLGYNKEQIVQFRLGITANAREDGGGMTDEKINDFLQRLKNIPGVKNATNYAYFMDDFGTTTGLDWPGKEADKTIFFGNVAAGYDFIETLQIKLAAGRAYSREYATDHEKIIFNQTAVREMGIEAPIGKTVTLWGKEREIVGIMEDFHYDKLYEGIAPFFLNLTTNDFASNILVKLEAGQEKAAIDRIKKTYQDFFIAGLPFEYSFLDEQYEQLYAQEIQTGQLSKYAAGMAIFIACLGLFGFASFTMQRRLKEMAVRKILGSGAINIVQLLLRSFLSPIFIAFLIAVPVSYLIAQHYLSAFTFHVELSVWHFGVAGMIILILTVLTVGVQLVKATNVSMVEYLSQGE
ncbi:MAG: ABC transporter permease [Bacteroidota bacterium]